MPVPDPAWRPQARAAEARSAHRDSVLERDALQRVSGADPVLHMALDDAGAQRRPHAGRAAVRAGLGAGQAQRQLGLVGLGAGARARRRGGCRGPVRTGAAFPRGRRRREIRHGSCQGRRGAELAKGAAPPPPPLPPRWGCCWPCRGGGRREAERGAAGPAWRASLSEAVRRGGEKELRSGRSVRVLRDKALLKRGRSEACGPREAYGGVLELRWTPEPCRLERTRLQPLLPIVDPHQALLTLLILQPGRLAQWYLLYDIKVLVGGNLKITEQSFYSSSPPWGLQLF